MQSRASFTLWISVKKCHILVEVIFDPSNCLENTNKHWETTLHIPKPHQGPKEHQNGALGSNSSTLKWPWTLCKWPENQHFCIFSNFFHFLATSGPGNLWKQLSTWEYLPEDTRSTILGQLEQIIGLKMAISKHWKFLRNGFFCIWPLHFDQP